MPFHSPRRLFSTAIVICLIAGLAGCKRGPSVQSDPVLAANEFFALLESNKPHEAYDESAFGFQAEQSYDAFLSNSRGLGLIGGQAPAWTVKQIGTKDAHLTGTAVNRSGQPVNLTVTLTADGGAWKVYALETAVATGGMQNHFTLVGHDTGFNDVYHQPMPTQPQLDALVRSTMVTFSKSIATNDFHVFYQSISQQWRDGARVTGAESDGVTENILKSHFSGFVEKKIDLSGVADQAPVFDVTPRINDAGLLMLEGHFPTQPYRLNFQLEYIYELPWWKLFGINITMTEQ